MMMMRILIPCGDHMAVMTVMRMGIILIRVTIIRKDFHFKVHFSLDKGDIVTVTIRRKDESVLTWAVPPPHQVRSLQGTTAKS